MSNARGMPGGMFKLRFDWCIMSFDRYSVLAIKRVAYKPGIDNLLGPVYKQVYVG